VIRPFPGKRNKRLNGLLFWFCRRLDFRLDFLFGLVFVELLFFSAVFFVWLFFGDLVVDFIFLLFLGLRTRRSFGFGVLERDAVGAAAEKTNRAAVV
jgi:hypothetical protein